MPEAGFYLSTKKNTRETSDDLSAEKEILLNPVSFLLLPYVISV